MSSVSRETGINSASVVRWTNHSQTVHDTTAQSAYIIGLGIDTAKAQAGDGNPELTATVEETSRLSRSTIWDLRHPISMGHLRGTGAGTGSKVTRRP